MLSVFPQNVFHLLDRKLFDLFTGLAHELFKGLCHTASLNFPNYFIPVAELGLSGSKI
jgi:hypothetical protein